jgi:hypothetical protein
MSAEEDRMLGAGQSWGRLSEGSWVRAGVSTEGTHEY